MHWIRWWLCGIVMSAAVALGYSNHDAVALVLRWGLVPDVLARTFANELLPVGVRAEVVFP